MMLTQIPSPLISEPYTDVADRITRSADPSQEETDVRLDRIHELREQLERGELDDPARLDAAIDRLADDLGVSQ